MFVNTLLDECTPHCDSFMLGVGYSLTTYVCAPITIYWYCLTVVQSHVPGMKSKHKVEIVCWHGPIFPRLHRLHANVVGMGAVSTLHCMVPVAHRWSAALRYSEHMPLGATHGPNVPETHAGQ